MSAKIKVPMVVQMWL